MPYAMRLALNGPVKLYREQVANTWLLHTLLPRETGGHETPPLARREGRAIARRGFSGTGHRRQFSWLERSTGCRRKT